MSFTLDIFKLIASHIVYLSTTAHKNRNANTFTIQVTL